MENYHSQLYTYPKTPKMDILNQAIATNLNMQNFFLAHATCILSFCGAGLSLSQCGLGHSDTDRAIRDHECTCVNQ